MRISRTGVAFGVAGVAVLVVGAYISAPGGDTSLVHSCVAKDGTIRIVTANTTACKPQETPLDWNIQGPQGLQGPQGAQGPQGPQGPSGVSGLIRVQEDSPLDFVSSKEVRATCPEGTKVVGGGYVRFFGGSTV